MAKPKNYYIYRVDESVLDRLQTEYEFTGRYCRREPGTLIVLALPPPKAKEKKEKKRGRR